MIVSNMFSLFSLLGSIAVSSAYPHQAQVIDAPSTQSTNPIGRRAPTVDAPSSYVLNLRKTDAKTPSSEALRKRYASPEAPVAATFGGLSYVANITIDGQEFDVVLDTGSSDLWVAYSNYTCVNGTSEQEISQDDCGLLSTYTPGPDFETISGLKLNSSYGDGSFVTGDFAYSTVELAGITVDNQTTGFANIVSFHEPGISGLLGLAYPGAEGQASVREYDNFFTKMYKTGLVSPTFSLALERNGTGYLALGGLPPVSYEGPLVSTPIEKLGNETEFTGYGITVDQINVGGKQVGGNATKFQAIVDSGTTLLQALPESIVVDVNSQFSPPATNDTGIWTVPCNATAPNVTIQIAGTEFTINPVDLLALPTDDGICSSGFQGGLATDPHGPAILGDVFMLNVISIFDVGASEMRFGQRWD